MSKQEDWHFENLVHQFESSLQRKLVMSYESIWLYSSIAKNARKDLYHNMTIVAFRDAIV